MKPVHLCIPVLKRYDKLKELLVSLQHSIVPVDTVHIINNGRDVARLVAAMRETPGGVKTDILTPDVPMGVAESWNWFIDNVPEERVIANDDIVFAPESLGTLLASDADLVWAQGVGFSCFLLRDRCVEKIGFFDETISPGYAYYEDEDYLQRLDGKGTRPPSAIAADVICGVTHARSSTLQRNTPEEMQEHHRKFLLAQRNYITKWHLEASFK